MVQEAYMHLTCGGVLIGASIWAWASGKIPKSARKGLILFGVIGVFFAATGLLQLIH